MMAQTMLAITIAAVLMVSHGVSAKRGCSSFGHSCFGGHGKRSDDSIMAELRSPPMMARQQMGEDETPPHPVYPHPYNVLQPGDNIIPVRDGGAYDREDTGARDVMKIKFRNIFKQWMENMRRSQQNDDSFFDNK